MSSNPNSCKFAEEVDCGRCATSAKHNSLRTHASRFLRPLNMPKAKSKTTAKRLKVLDEELVEGAETAARVAATEKVADDALFADDRAGSSKASKRAAAAAAAGAAPSSASAAVVSKSAAPSKALVYSRPAKTAKPQSEVERRKIERLVERAAAGDVAAISAVPRGKKIAARSAVGDLWGADEPAGAQTSSAAAATAVPDEALVPALVKPAALSGLKRKTPYSAVKGVAQAAAAAEAALVPAAKAAAKAAAPAPSAAAAAAPVDAAASVDGAAAVEGEAAVAKLKTSKGRRQKRRELAAAIAAGAAPKGVSLTLSGAAEGGLSYHPTKADHETAVLRAAHAELAAQALRKTKAQLAKEADAAAAGRAMAADSDDDDDSDDDEDESSDDEDAAAGGTAAVAAAIKPVKAAAKASRRPVMVPLTEELTGSLRTAKHVAPGALARDLMRDIASAGMVTEKKFGRSTGKKASRISKKRSKGVEFPRKPAAAFGVIKGDSGDW